MTRRETTLPALPVPSETACRLAHECLMEGFESVRAYGAWVDGPFGRVFLAKTNRGLCRVSFRKSEDRLLAELERKGLLAGMAPERLDAERRQIDEYFQGRRRRFTLPVDLRWGTPFQRQVLESIRRLSFGKVCCYKDVAEDIGRPRSSRAVGNALGSNPVAIVIPCHRVVASGGKLGGYTGGLDIKRTLMEIEGISL